MKAKNKKKIFVIAICLALVALVSGIYYFQVVKPDSFISIGKYYDSDGNLITKSFAVVGGVEGVRYITLKINIENKDTIPLDFELTSLTPSEELINSRPITNTINIQSAKTGYFETGLIDIEKYVGKNQTFCATIKSKVIPYVRESAEKSGCINIVVSPNPGASFNVQLGSSAQPTTSTINPSCTENWQCSDWSSCSSNSQSRTCSDLNNCGSTGSKPLLQQSCVASSVQTSNTLGTLAGYGGSWIKLDTNSDGVIETYNCGTSHYSAGSSTCGSGSYILTYGGYEFHSYSGSSGFSVLICPQSESYYIKCS